MTDGEPPSLVFYDSFSRALRVVSVSPDDRLTFSDSFFDNRGNAVASTRPYYAADPLYATYTKFDALGRVESVSHEARLTLDSNGQITTASTSIGQSVFTYSNFVSTETRPAVGYTVATGVDYSRTGTVVTTHNSLGKVTEVTETGVTSETGKASQTLSATISYSYDGFGQLEVMVDPIGATTTYTVDAYGRRSSAKDPNRGTWSFGYNPLGELVLQTDQDASTTTFHYDRIGRMTSRSINGLSTTWQYDTAAGKGIGKLSTITSFSDVGEVYEYDDYGAVKKHTRTVGAGAAQLSFVREFGYDAYRRLKTISYDDSQFVERRGYSKYGHWVALRNDTTGGRYWFGASFEADGRVKTIKYGNGLLTDRVYNEDMGGVLDSVQTGTDANATSAQHLQYFYEKGRIGSVYQRFDYLHDIAEGFTYDPLTRLSSTYLGSTSAQSSAIAAFQRSEYTYDLVGDLLSKNTFDASGQIVGSASVGTYNYFTSSEWGVAHGAHAIKSIDSVQLGRSATGIRHYGSC